MSKKKNNNYAFIDGQNLDKSIREQGKRLDYEKFREYLANNFAVSKAFYFVGYLEQYVDGFYKDLRNVGYSLSFRKPVVDTDGGIKANVDSNLITHTMMKFDKYDKAIIVAGDSDYYCLCKYLMRHNKLCQVLVPCKAKCPNIYKRNLKFRNWISYLSRQSELFL